MVPEKLLEKFDVVFQVGKQEVEVHVVEQFILVDFQVGRGTHSIVQLPPNDVAREV